MVDCFIDVLVLHTLLISVIILLTDKSDFIKPTIFPFIP